MRRFIVVDFKRNYTVDDFGDLSLKMYDRESLLYLFDDLELLYNPPDEWDKDAESAAIDDINESNGDGDHYFYIAEIKNDKLEVLIGDK